MSETTIATNAQIDALPEKMRAHAAAKALGLTSKDLLAALAERGEVVKSAQSGVTREQLALLAGPVDAAPEAADPAAEHPEVAAEDTPPVEDTPKKAPRKRSSAKKSATATTPAQGRSSARGKKAAAEDGRAAETLVDSPDDTAGATEPTSARADEPAGGPAAAEDPAAVEETSYSSFSIVTGEVGAAEERGRGGRGGRGRKRPQSVPGFSPLFLTPGDAPAEDSGISVITVAGDARDDDSNDTAGSADLSDTDSRDAGGDRRGSANEGTDDSPDDESGQGGRRRRRGRRGRGRGRGEDAGRTEAEGTASAEGDDDSADSDEHSEEHDADGTTAANGNDGDDSGQKPEGSSSRRRRRRRKKSSGGGDEESGANPGGGDQHSRSSDGGRNGHDGKNTPAAPAGADEIQGISGSTRLEAKRRRRRPGGDGRRRSGILSEAEFLARREAVERVMVVRERERHDGSGALTQVGVLEDKVLVEHFVTTEAQRSMVGNIYLGRVQNVLPSMEAAFIDIGRGRNGVLYAGEVDWHAAGLGGRSRRIEQALRPGDQVLVQVTKDPVGQKGARLSTQISLAGRFLVFVPGGSSTGISRKLPDVERKRLKAILKEVVPSGNGVIIRTAAEGVSEEDLRRDVERLSAKWDKISAESEKAKSNGKSATIRTLYEEPDLLVKVVRDLFNEDFSKLVVQGEKSWRTVHEYVSELAPEMEDRLEHFENPDVDVFSVHRIDEQLHKALERTVWLPSGGTLVIDRTEAMTVVDVNTGKFTGSGGNLEQTVTRNNLEAAEEIVRQLRLRDIGGMVIIDFIDMVLESNQDLVVRRLTEALGRDRTRHQVSEVTSLGLVQLTRKKLGTGLVEAFSEPCTHCGGRGIILRDDPVLSSPTSDDGHAHRDHGKGGRGRNGGNDHGNGNGHGHAEKAEKKDGPSPSAHPMILAMSKEETEGRHGTSHADQGPGAGNPGDDGARPASGAGATAATGGPEGGEAATAERPERRRRSRRATRGSGSPAGEEQRPIAEAEGRGHRPAAEAPAGDDTAHDTAAAVRASEDSTPHVAETAEDLVPARRARSRRRIVRSTDAAPSGQPETTATAGTSVGADADAAPAPGVDSVDSVASVAELTVPAAATETANASATAAPAAGEARPTRRRRRTVTRDAGTAEHVDVPVTSGAAPAEPPVVAEGRGSVTELTGHEVEVVAAAEELAVVSAPTRRRRRTATRPAGEAE